MIRRDREFDIKWVEFKKEEGGRVVGDYLVGELGSVIGTARLVEGIVVGQVDFHLKGKVEEVVGVDGTVAREVSAVKFNPTNVMSDMMVIRDKMDSYRGY